MKNTDLDRCTLLACQIQVPIIRSEEEKRLHLKNLSKKIATHLDRQSADLVVLPELSVIEYSREAFDQLDSLAEDLDGVSVFAMRELAVRYRSVIVFGLPRRVDDQYRISQVIVGADGEIAGCYDKLHICQYGASMEKEYFQRGENLCVFEVCGYTFAPIICYDIRIPELSRVLALKYEVDCILHCGAYYRDESFATWHAFAITRAMENQLYFLSLNRAGEQYGDSVFCTPWMDESQRAIHFAEREEDFRFLTIDRNEINEARRKYTFLKDRIGNYHVMPNWISKSFS